MKSLLIILLVSCASKYQTFNTIDKRNFSLTKEHSPITKKFIKGKKEKVHSCAGQILFSSNAKNITDRALKPMLSRICPKSIFLIDAKVTETWWTTIIYSRSCVEVEAYCPRY